MLMKRETRNAWITVAIIAVFAIALIAIATWTSERYDLGTGGAIAGQDDVIDTGVIDEADDDDAFRNDTEAEENIDEGDMNDEDLY